MGRQDDSSFNMTVFCFIKYTNTPSYHFILQKSCTDAINKPFVYSLYSTSKWNSAKSQIHSEKTISLHSSLHWTIRNAYSKWKILLYNIENNIMYKFIIHFKMRQRVAFSWDHKPVCLFFVHILHVNLISIILLIQKDWFQ